MGLRHDSPLRVLATVFFSIGVLGMAGGSSATWTVLTLAALLSALLLPAMLAGGPVRLTIARQPEVTR